jgi:hypothetical protein
MWEKRGERDRKRETYPRIVRSVIRSCQNIVKDKESRGKGEENDRAFVTLPPY